MLRPHIRTDGLMADFCDGSLVKSLPLFQSHPTSLQLIAYFDEVEVCDPLAARFGIHKLGNTNNYHCHSYMYKRDCLYNYVYRALLLYPGEFTTRASINT